MFERNEGFIDRSLRVLVGTGLLLAGLFLAGGWKGSLPGLVLAGFALLPLLTGLTGFCPLYIPFGFSTLRKEQETLAGFKSMMDACRYGIPNSRQMCGLDSRSLQHKGDADVQVTRAHQLQA